MEPLCRCSWSCAEIVRFGRRRGAERLAGELLVCEAGLGSWTCTHGIERLVQRAEREPLSVVHAVLTFSSTVRLILPMLEQLPGLRVQSDCEPKTRGKNHMTARDRPVGRGRQKRARTVRGH